MASDLEIQHFLALFHHQLTKTEVLFLDQDIDQLLKLEISARRRQQCIEGISALHYVEGPIIDKDPLFNVRWRFSSNCKGKKVNICLALTIQGNLPICVAFNKA